jgi:hypothetical protein
MGRGGNRLSRCVKPAGPDHRGGHFVDELAGPGQVGRAPGGQGAVAELTGQGHERTRRPERARFRGRLVVASAGGTTRLVTRRASRPNRPAPEVRTDRAPPEPIAVTAPSTAPSDHLNPLQTITATKPHPGTLTNLDNIITSTHLALHKITLARDHGHQQDRQRRPNSASADSRARTQHRQINCPFRAELARRQGADLRCANRVGRPTPPAVQLKWRNLRRSASDKARQRTTTAPVIPRADLQRSPSDLDLPPSSQPNRAPHTEPTRHL